MAQQRLKHMRWPLLRRGSRVRGRARQKLNALLSGKLASFPVADDQPVGDSGVLSVIASTCYRQLRKCRGKNTGTIWADRPQNSQINPSRLLVELDVDRQTHPGKLGSRCHDLVVRYHDTRVAMEVLAPSGDWVVADVRIC